MYPTARLSNFHFLPSPAHSACGQGILPLLQPSLTSLPKLKQPLADEVAPLQSGLRTPPADVSMGTAYQAPNLASYDNHHVHHSAYASTLGASDRTRPAMAESGLNPYPRYPVAQSAAQQPSQSRVTTSSSYPSASQATHSRQSTRPSTPTSNPASGSRAEQAVSTGDSSLTSHSLQIPSCISLKGGSLDEFAAQITCLFWFESTKVLESAEKIRSLPPNAPVRRFAELAIPSHAFKGWVRCVLGTTQVTANVVLLALMFIYRLKKANPTVKGRAGSEYRLLTVALMLGNKFLDDNTYTNKTWAEVSGISVGEIHVMEVEFLSNMRYSLLASKEQWEEWLVKLAKFWEYCERAQRAPVSPIAIPSPSHRNFASPLPSPTGTLQLTPATQTGSQPLGTYSPGQSYLGAGGGQTYSGPYQNHSAVSPLAAKPDLHNSFRKRSLAEEDPTEPPAKRVNRQVPSQQQQLPAHQAQHQPTQPPHSRTSSNAVPEPLRLPVPNLTLNTNYASTASPVPSYPPSTYAPQQQSALSLPPLVPGVRAMATVYPSSSSSYVAQAPVMVTSGPALPPGAVSVTPTAAYSNSAYGTPTKRLSPQNALTPAAAAYATSSPLTESFHQSLTPVGTMSGVHTPISHSPSVYLQQRPSPYKPVRHVNTLLYPPPSASLHEYHLSTAIPVSQMHYQPLGRRNEFRTGIVPEFMIHGPYGGTGRHHSLTPVPGSTLGSLQGTPANPGQFPN